MYVNKLRFVDFTKDFKKFIIQCILFFESQYIIFDFGRLLIKSIYIAGKKNVTYAGYGRGPFFSFRTLFFFLTPMAV